MIVFKRRGIIKSRPVFMNLQKFTRLVTDPPNYCILPAMLRWKKNLFKQVGKAPETQISGTYEVNTKEKHCVNQLPASGTGRSMVQRELLVVLLRSTDLGWRGTRWEIGWAGGTMLMLLMIQEYREMSTISFILNFVHKMTPLCTLIGVNFEMFDIVLV